MYARTLSIYGFRCFGKAVLDFQYPGRESEGPLEYPNVNLIVGDNGGGKSSVLRAIAIAALAPALLESGFVPYRLVRRPGAPNALLKLVAELDPLDVVGLRGRVRIAPEGETSITLMARIDRRGSGSLDRLHLDKAPDSPIERLIYDDFSHTFFVVGYGATRRAETGDFSESSSRKTRGLRYQRVAGLFEDHVALRPIQAWLPRIKSKARKKEAIKKIASVLPEPLKFNGKFDERESQFVFTFDGRQTPFTALSDGYKAFLSWIGDLTGHLCDIAPDGIPIDGFSGIVLVDEIDLHLHPAWQRTVIPTLASAFPRLQFVMTSHSPLITSTLRKENVFVTETADDGTATVKQIGESVHGRSTDQLLLSSYFGLQSTLSPSLEATNKTLFARAAEGDSRAALAFLEQLSAPANTSAEVLPAVAQALNKATVAPASKPSMPRSAANEGKTAKRSTAKKPSPRSTRAPKKRTK